MRSKIRSRGLQLAIHVDSAGTHAYHVGEPPDERSQHHAALRGYDLSSQRARQLTEADYRDFDLILAMDWDNLALLLADCPPGLEFKLRRLMEFAPDAGHDSVPDPYYGGTAGFETVLDCVEAASEGLIRHLQICLGQKSDSAV